MIQHRAIERFGGRGKTPRASAIRVARSRIAARMVVRQDDAGAAELGSIGDDRAQRE
jgi:hypothetical protein